MAWDFQQPPPCQLSSTHVDRQGETSHLWRGPGIPNWTRKPNNYTGSPRTNITEMYNCQPQPTEELFILASWLGLLPAFETRITSCGELLLEFIDPTSRIYKLQFSRVERVALVANVDLQFLSSAVCHKFVPTATRYLGLNILGVDAFFHRRGLYNLLLVRWNLALFILAEDSKRYRRISRTR